MEPAVRFSVLGPVRAWRDDVELDPRPRQLRLILALLLVRAGRSVSPDEFAALLWGEDRPAQATNIVHRHLGALRRLLEPGLPARATGRWLERAGGGYRLAVDASSLDLLEFRGLADAGRRAAEAGDPVTALTHRTAALRVWHGRCAAGLDPSAEMLPEFVAVDHERAAVACAAADGALDIGDLRDLVPTLRELADQHQLDEALQARLMLILAADGKQAEAVAAYETVRARLSGELGVDPGPELRAAYERLLRQQTPEQPVRYSASIPSQVPLSIRFFSGREAELIRLDRLRSEVGRERSSTVTVVVDGLPGIGKTSLVVHWAHRVAAQFPDGRLFVNLQGFDPGDAVVESGEALAHLLNGLCVPHAQMPADVEARATLFRTLMAERRMLIILDNARDEEQVRPLLPAAPGSLVVVTSRNRLTGLVAQQGAYPLTLQPPTLTEARNGMRARLGDLRVEGDEAALDEIIDRCGRLPLAMAVVGARAVAYPDWKLRDIAAELRQAESLDFFDGEEPRSDVRSVFSWSYRRLSEPAARLFRLLPTHPGPDFGLATVASLAGIAPRTARDLIAELTRTRLLNEIRRGRYAFHDLIRVYAMELGSTSDAEADRHEALARVLDHLCQTGYSANLRLLPAKPLLPPLPPRDGVTPQQVPGVPEAMAWFTTELAVLEASAGITGVPGFRAWRLVESLMPYYQRRGMHHSWGTSSALALQAAEAENDREGQAHMHRVLAGARVFSGRTTSAIAHLERALALFDELGRTLEKGYAYCNLGWVRYARGELDEALGHYEHALKIFEHADNERATALALLGAGYCRTRAGAYRTAVRDLDRASAILDRAGDASSGGSCASVLGDALVGLGRFDEGIESRRRAEELFLRAGNDIEVADNGHSLGDILHRAGRRSEAVAAWREARRRYAELGSAAKVAELDALLRAS